MTITYLHHSGFVVDCKNVILIFDPIVEIPEKFLNTSKPVIIFVSHSHGDHYSRSIWNYKDKNITYVLSYDIFRLPKKDTVIKVNVDETVNLDNCKIHTFGSTDQGVSFLVETETEVIFFAGDLNWWAWDPRTRPHINPKVEEEDYKKILKELKTYLNGKVIDVAFVPVDPRLDLPQGELLAAQYFIDYLHPKELVPMHFWEDFRVIDRLKKSIPDSTTKIGTFSDSYQEVKF